MEIIKLEDTQSLTFEMWEKTQKLKLKECNQLKARKNISINELTTICRQVIDALKIKKH